MNARQINLVKSTWSIVAQLEPEVVGSLFYTRLLETNPELKTIFHTPVAEQSRKLISMISYVINKLDKLESVIDEVKKLAVRHVRYGVKEQHYAKVGAALLWTLEKGLSDMWNEEIEAAWIACYTILSGAMIQASQYEEV